VTAHRTGVSRPVSDLADERDRLDALAATDDEGNRVRAVFSWSLSRTHFGACRLFRLLGCTQPPGRHSSSRGTLATAPASARRLLETLASVHLLEEIGRMGTGPDLLRA